MSLLFAKAERKKVETAAKTREGSRARTAWSRKAPRLHVDPDKVSVGEAGSQSPCPLAGFLRRGWGL